MSKRKQQWRTQRKRKVAEARESGLCIWCTTNATEIGRPGCTACYEQRAARAANRRAERRPKPPVIDLVAEIEAI